MSQVVHAGKCGDLATLKALVAKGCDVNMTQGEDQYTALYWAACNGHSHVVSFLVSQGVRIDQPVKWGSTALHAAAERGQRESIFYLTKGNCNVNAQNLNHRDTPLHLAAYRGHLQVCQDLLRYGADIRITNRQRKTALDEALSQGQHQVYEVLLQWIQDPTVSYNSVLRRSSSFPTEWTSSSMSSLSQHGEVNNYDRHSLYTKEPSGATTPTTESMQISPQEVHCQRNTITNTNDRRGLPGNRQCLHLSGVVNEVNMKNSWDTQGSQINHKEVHGCHNNINSHARNLLANGHQGGCEDEIDGSCDPRTKIPSEHSSNTTMSHDYVQGSSEHILDQNSSYFKQNERYDISPNYTITSSKSSPSQHLHTFYPTVASSQFKLLHHREAESPHIDSHTELLNVLQWQIIKERDQVEFLKQKNTELWIQCEKYRNTEGEKNKLLTIYGNKYKKCLVENEHLKKKLKENEVKTKAAIVKLMQHYKKIPTQSNFVTSGETSVTMAERTPVESTVMTSSEDLIKLNESPSESGPIHQSSKATEGQKLPSDSVNETENLSHPKDSSSSQNVLISGLDDFVPSQEQNQQVGTVQSSWHLIQLDEKIPQQCSDEDDIVSTKKVAQQSESLNDSSFGSSTQSSDSLSSKMVQSYTANCTDHKELFSAILPVFQSMDVSLQTSMSESLRRQLQKRNSKIPATRLLEEERGREWHCGIDFFFLDDFPINRHSHYEGSSSLVFRIQHNTKVYILKMMINLLDLSQTEHGAGQSLPQFLFQQFSAEHDIPSALPSHPNVARVLHYYHGDTQHFKGFLPTIIPSEIKDTCVDMANKTTFLVMPLYPTTLARLFEETIIDVEEATNAIPEIFVLQKLYDVLSAVQHLEEHKVAHRDIKADNVFLDHELRAVLGDFGFARRFQGVSGERIAFVDRSQIIAGNCNAWTPELESMNRGGPESLKEQVSLEDIYSTTDSYAVGKMFFNLLCQKSKNHLRCALADIPDTYSTALRYIVKSLCHLDTKQRLKTQDALVILGLLLFGPELEEIRCKTDCIIWHQSRMMKLLVQKTSTSTSRESIVGSYTCTIEESIMINNGLLEKAFFSNVSAQQIWDCFATYQSLKSTHLVS